jgi:thiaminase/transcriptional activator TenA
VGKEIAKNASENNPYRRWIATYESLEFEVQVDRFLEIIETLGLEADPKTREEMEKAFIAGTRLEIRFFRESWLDNPG